MIRAGVIWNQKSHRNQRAGGLDPLPGVVVEVAPEDPVELHGTLRRFAAQGVDLVVIDGGDGTIREVLTRLPESFGGRIPRLAILPNGKTNALALDIGSPLGTTLEHVLDAAEAGTPVKRRQCLEIVRPGQTLAERRGFLFGMGAFVRATELAQKHHSLGLFDNAAIAATLATAALGALAGGPGNAWRRGEAARLSVGAADRWFLAMASTLKRFPLGLRPFGEPREGLKLIAVEAPPRRLHRALPVLLRGGDATWLATSGYRRSDPDAFDLAWSGDFVLDGEIYEGGELTVRRGPELEFVVP